MYSVMNIQAGSRQLGKVTLEDTYDGSRCSYTTHFFSAEEFNAWADARATGSRVVVSKEFPYVKPSK